jgi:hypothetical protein
MPTPQAFERNLAVRRNAIFACFFIPLGWGLGDISKVAMGIAKCQARLSAWGAVKVYAFAW